MIAVARMTDEELAFASGITPQTLSKYRQRGCRATTPESVQEWRSKNIRQNGAPTIGEQANPSANQLAAKDLNEAEQRARIAKLEEEARDKRRKNDIEDGLLEYRDAVEQCVSELVLRIKHRLEGSTEEVRNEFPAELRDIACQLWADRVHLILTEMSQWKMETKGSG